MQTMFFNDDTTNALVSLGGRIRSARIARGDSQSLLARRIGVSVPTLRELENGSPTVAIGTLVAALWMLSRLADVDLVLENKESLFDRAARDRKPRRRVSKAAKGSARGSQGG